MATTLSKPRPAIRTFLAVNLSDEARTRLEDLQRELLPHARSLKLVPIESLHITVRFIGEIDASRQVNLEAAARDAAGTVAPFRLRLSSLGTFPRRGTRPRVVWVGLEPDSGYASLQRLFAALEDALDARRFGRETKEYAPHLTLARVRDGCPPEELRSLIHTITKLTATVDVRVQFDVGALILFRSVLGRAGPHYSTLAEISLGKVAAM